MKHARVEEAAYKKIKDLEMELSGLKNQNEELQAEQEILQQTASEQLYQMEAMRGRLEQQKQSAPFAQRQATSRLELELHDANAKIQALEQTISDKELEVFEINIPNRIRFFIFSFFFLQQKFARTPRRSETKFITSSLELTHY